MIPARARWVIHGAAIAAYVIMTVAATSPAAFKLSAGALGQPVVDVFCHLWDIWWGWWSLFEGRGDFFYTDRLHYPPGVSTSIFLAGPLLYAVAGALRAALGDLLATYNAVVLLSILCTCLGGYVAGLRFVKDPGPAFLIGVVAAFNPLVFHQVQLGIIEFVNLGWAMLFFASVHRLAERRDLRSALVSLLWYLVAATWCWYMGLLLVVLAGLYLLVMTDFRELFTSARRYLALLAAWGAGIGAVMLLAAWTTSAGPVGAQLQTVEARLAHAMAGQQTRLYGDDATHLRTHARRLGIQPEDAASALEVKLHNSLDLAGALTAWRRDAPGARWFPLRWLAPLALAVIAILWSRSRLVLACAAIAVVTSLIALGPCLLVLGSVKWWSYGWTPYGLLTRFVSTLGRMQFPDRMLIPAALALAVLAGFGLRRLCADLPRGGAAVAAAACAALLTAAGGISLPGYPLEQTELPVPRFYARLAATPGDLAIIDVPFAQAEGVTRDEALARHAFYQTIHHKRIHSGPVPSYLTEASRPSAVAGNPLLRRLQRLADGEAAPASLEAERRGIAELQRHGFSHIVLHESELKPRTFRAMRALLSGLLGPPEDDISADRAELGDILAIYRIPPAGTGREAGARRKAGAGRDAGAGRNAGPTRTDGGGAR